MAWEVSVFACGKPTQPSIKKALAFINLIISTYRAVLKKEVRV